MQEQKQQDFITSLPKDVRHYLFTWFDTQAVGRLSAVNHDFKLFCDDRMVWVERLRRVFNIHAARSDDPKKIYQRLKGEYAELGAYLKQFCILKLLLDDDSFSSIIIALNDLIINKTWRPLNDTELLELTIKYGGCKDDFEYIADMINLITSEQELFASPQWQSLKTPNTKTVAEVMGQSMTLAFASMEKSIKDFVNDAEIPSESKQVYTGICLLGNAFLATPTFFSKRGQTEALITFLDRINKINFPDIKSLAEIPREVSIDYGEEIFKKALGHLTLFTSGSILQEPVRPSPELVEYLISRNAHCVKARDEASGFFVDIPNDDVDGYTAMYYNPLAMLLESISVVGMICKDDETALAYLRQLEKIAIMLLDNGEDLSRVFMPNIDPEKSHSPVELLRMTLLQNENNNHSEIDKERIRILKYILAYQPAPKPNDGEYVDNFPYANRA